MCGDFKAVHGIVSRARWMIARAPIATPHRSYRAISVPSYHIIIASPSHHYRISLHHYHYISPRSPCNPPFNHIRSSTHISSAPLWSLLHVDRLESNPPDLPVLAKTPGGQHATFAPSARRPTPFLALMKSHPNPNKRSQRTARRIPSLPLPSTQQRTRNRGKHHLGA